MQDAVEMHHDPHCAINHAVDDGEPCGDVDALAKLPPQEALHVLQQQNEQLQAKLFEARHAEEENSRLRKQIERLSSAGDSNGAAGMEQQHAADQAAKLERVIAP